MPAADVHFGKSSVLHRAGINLPIGQTSGDLARLDGLIEQYHPTQLIVLGDLVHRAAPLDAPWMGMVDAWRQRHPAIEMTLVADSHGGQFDARLVGFDLVEDEMTRSPFLLRHAPGAAPGVYVLAGHVLRASPCMTADDDIACPRFVSPTERD